MCNTKVTDLRGFFLVVGAALLILCLEARHASAEKIQAIDIVRSIQLDGISLQSKVDEVERYIASNPSLECKHTHVAARKSPFPNKPSIAEKKAWLCQSKGRNLEVQMVEGVIMVLKHSLGYDEAKDYIEATQGIRDTYESLRAAGLKDKALDPDNYVSYYEHDAQKLPEAISHQKLSAKITGKCRGELLKLSMDSNKAPILSSYGAYIKIEQIALSKRCKD
ncbi:MAG: hypothetical protein NZ828_10190 [Alphaproteobacteria bacterium]|jgi:hypothetical protein|nr:hypothetical protein [Alphaproteobacteria bacterium]